jgi:catechol 2,3-dioxygenase-like lactoylglutathione lyase family enzyme
MIRGIDHVVILVDELEAATARYRKLGFTVVSGGRHPRGTENALVCFRDGSYLELIAFWDPTDREHPFFRHLAIGPGVIAYALGAAELAGTVADLRQRGVPFGDPEPGARRRPDGAEVAWKMAFHGDDAAGELPFLIEDVTDRAVRVPGGTATEHANGSRGIARLIVAVDDLDAASSTYAGLAGSASVKQGDDAFDQRAHVAAFRVGAHRIELHEPIGSGPLTNRLAARGSGPYAVELEGTSERDILPSDSGGARLRIARRADDDTVE